MADTPGKAFRVLAESPVATNWGVLIAFVVTGFLAGRWANNMDNKIEKVGDRADKIDQKLTDFIQEYRSARHVAVLP